VPLFDRIPIEFWRGRTLRFSISGDSSLPMLVVTIEVPVEESVEAMVLMLLG
jgi:hypothetical protein